MKKIQIRQAGTVRLTAAACSWVELLEVCNAISENFVDHHDERRDQHGSQDRDHRRMCRQIQAFHSTQTAAAASAPPDS
jgi:hypothetical protein